MDIKIKVKDDGVWLHFTGTNVAIHMERIIRMCGPITAKELRTWRKAIIEEHQK